MKQFLSYFLSITLLSSIFLTPIQAKEENTHILVYVDEAEEYYLLDIKEKTMQVYIISANTYIPISALNNEATSLNSVNFSASYESLLTSIENFLQQEIPYYIYIDLNTLLKQVHLKEELSPKKDLDSLCNIALQIKQNINLKTILNYKKFIKTNLEGNQIYTLYKKFKNNSIRVTYYTLPYLIFEDCYIPLEKTFYLKEKVKP